MAETTTFKENTNASLEISPCGLHDPTLRRNARLVRESFPNHGAVSESRVRLPHLRRRTPSVCLRKHERVDSRQSGHRCNCKGRREPCRLHLCKCCRTPGNLRTAQRSRHYALLASASWRHALDVLP